MDDTFGDPLWMTSELPPTVMASRAPDLPEPAPLTVVPATPVVPLFAGIPDDTNMTRRAQPRRVLPPLVYDTYSSHSEPPVDEYDQSEMHQMTQVVPASHTGQSPVMIRRRPPVWPWVTAACMLLAGLMAGALLAVSLTDDEPSSVAPTSTVRPTTTVPTTIPTLVTVSPAQVSAALDAALDEVLAAASDGSMPAATGYDQLDKLVALHVAAAVGDLQSEIDALVVSLDENQVLAGGLSEDLVAANEELAAVVSERDVLAANLALMSGSSSELQTAITERDATLASVRAELATANAAVVTATDKANGLRTELDAANAKTVSLTSERDTAVAAYAKLNVKQAGTWVGVEVGKARAAAASNNWVIVEVPTESATTPVGQVIRQQPAPSATMVNGSVLYVEVAIAVR